MEDLRTYDLVKWSTPQSTFMKIFGTSDFDPEEIMLIIGTTTSDRGEAMAIVLSHKKDVFATHLEDLERLSRL